MFSRPLIRSLLAGLALCLSATALAVDVLPSFEQVRASHQSTEAQLLDRNAELLADLRLDNRVHRLPWVSLQGLSPAMREALLAAEDKRFFEHTGVDWKAFLGAAWQNLWSRSQRGASTLTMQLAGLLDPALHLPEQGRARRSIAQKWDQSLAALELERRWSKLQILEAYLNLAPFRGDLEGINAASQVLFRLSPQALTRREAVILAALLRGPNARPAVVARRACALAEVLQDAKLCPQVQTLAQARLDTPRNQPRATLATQLARDLLRLPGQSIRSTLDAGIQRKLLAIFERNRAEHAAALVLDNASGEILAWASDAASEQDPLLQRQRFALWWAPFVASLGIEQRSHTAASLLIDGDPVLDARDARSGQRTAWLSLRAALQSRNAGALRNLLHEVGSEAALERLHQLSLDNSTDPLLSELSPLQLANAWRSLVAGSYTAIGNNFLPAYGVPLDAALSRRIGSIEGNFITLAMLGDNGPNGWRSGWSLSSADGHTQLQVLSTDRFTVLASLSHHGRHAEDASRSLLAIAQETLAALQSESSRAPEAPDSLLSSIVVFEPPLEAVRREWFIKGSEIERVISDALPSGARISVPRHGQQLLLDPAGGNWTLSAQTARAVRWQIDGKLLGSGPQLSWQPQPGMHRVQLLGLRDEVLDSVEFEVLAPASN
ncbi:transglycosylase domain-containing protein [Uliginosibacterium sediminicola]|uniref:peptidoglycan glycosyltransferase n=1 Tax=Uliginosibacterium sediminicola TaxID=2024550 RepID=A0ABU9YV49_9RHOO